MLIIARCQREVLFAAAHFRRLKMRKLKTRVMSNPDLACNLPLTTTIMRTLINFWLFMH